VRPHAYLRIRTLSAIAFIGFCGIAFGQSVTLTVGASSGTAGGSIVVPISMTSAGGAQPAALQWSVGSSSDIVAVTFAAGPAATNAGKSLSCNANTCLIYGINLNVIPDGVVAIATLQISPNPSTLAIPIQITGVFAATAPGDPISAAGVSGTASLLPGPTVSALACVPVDLSTGATSTCTVSLNKSAVSATVYARSNNAIVTVPDSISLAPGQSTASFQAAVGSVNVDQTAVVTASVNGQSQSATLNLRAGPLPTADSVSPSGSAGLRQTFTFVFSDSQSAADLSAAVMVFAPTLVAENSCFVVYDRNRGIIQLESDDLTSTANKLVDSATTLQNSQCVIGATSVTAAVLSTIITLDITFKNEFTGLKNIYMYGADGDGSVNTGWTQRGTYMVAVSPPPLPTVDSVSPSSGGGPRQTFTFAFSDRQSATNLSAAVMVFAPALVAENSCFVVYDRDRGIIELEWDDLTDNETKLVNSSALLENSQCVIGATSVTATALSITITLDITFKNAFTGLKNIYMYGADGDGSLNTGWVQKGTWTPNAGAE
jgi:hypothetical protein